jgi:hypothetical protein
VAADAELGREEPWEIALSAEDIIDWEEAYTQVLKDQPDVREKVESGVATKRQVLG